MAQITPVLLIHILGAIVGLLSGYAAMMLRKGSGWHGAAGSIFFVSMVSMSTAGTYIAVFDRPNGLNRVVALLTLYLVTTAWWSARHREGKPGPFERGAMLFVLADALLAMSYGFEAANSPNGMKDRIPAALFFVFGSIALLCAVSDVRMLLRGGAAGMRRIARHLWRMCLALLIATLSFYPGQARLFPPSVRESGVVFIPHILLIGSMLFWAVRVRVRKRVHRADPIAAAAQPSSI